MSKEKFKSGDILRIPLPNNLGFGFAKGVDLIELNSETRYPTLIRVYNYRTLNPETDIKNFINNGLILSPILIGGIGPAVSEGLWKRIENIALSKGEEDIPFYKKPEPDKANVKTWYYVENADISKKVKTTYENVKHLETLGAIGSDLVGTKIAMALLRDEENEIREYFKLEEYFEKEFYKQVVSIPAYYTLPSNMQGKPLVY